MVGKPKALAKFCRFPQDSSLIGSAVCMSSCVYALPMSLHAPDESPGGSPPRPGLGYQTPPQQPAVRHEGDGSNDT